MADVSRPPTLSARHWLLRPYANPSPLSRRARTLLLAGFVFFCFIYGAAFALLAPYLMVPLLVVPAALVAVAIWALPDSRFAPVHALEYLFFAFVIVLVIWPNYLAIDLPGLPWITVARLTGTPLDIVLLLCVSASSEFRAFAGDALRRTPWLWKVLCAFVAIQCLSVGFSSAKGDSIDKLINDETGWTAAFFVGAFVFTKRGRATAFAYLLCAMTLILCGIGAWEHHLSRLPWAGHIPSFLQINDEAVQRILHGTARQGQYRVQATFSTSVGFGEYIAIVMPFVLSVLVSKRPILIRSIAFIAIPILIWAALVTQSRAGMVGLVADAILFSGAIIFVAWRRNPNSLAATSTVLLAPFGGALAFASTLFVPGLKYRIWGGGADQISTQARIDQVHMGMPKILSHPWGYGVGQGAIALGFRNLEGVLTIDSYTLRLALEYGIIGMIVFYAVLGVAVAYAGISAVTWSRSNDPEAQWFVPAAVSVLAYVVIKSVFAQEDNQSLIFMIMGMVVGLRHRLSQTAAALENVVQPPIRRSAGPQGARA